MTPEFSRAERLDTIGSAPRAVTIEADANERAALAARFGLVAIERLAATLEVRRDAAGIAVTGRVSAAVTQACTVSGEPLVAAVDEPVALRFVESLGVEGEEVELGADALDTVEIENGVIDLGEAAAETMALALDPFPRAPGAEEALRDAGVLGEEDTGPLAAALKALKDQL